MHYVLKNLMKEDGSFMRQNKIKSSFGLFHIIFECFALDKQW